MAVAFKFLGAANLINAVLLALDQGILDRVELTKGLDRIALDKLTEREVDVLDVMTRNNGANSSNKEIASVLFSPSETIDSRFNNIAKKTNLTRMQTAMLYAEATKDMKKENVIFSRNAF